MLNGFRKQTADLDDYERTELLPIMVKCLKRHIGKENVITNAEMCTRMREFGYKIDAARLRKIVNYIRIKGYVQCLIATGNGYYVATDAGEMDDYIRSLTGRVEAITAVKEAMIEQMQRMGK
jgi:hypothetical protein